MDGYLGKAILDKAIYVHPPTWMVKRMTARMPTQEWRVYMLGMGGTFRLWLSNAA
jgi:hypothetical protein